MKNAPPAVVQAVAAVKSDVENEDAWDAADEAARETQEPDAVAQLYLEVLSADVTPELANRIGQRAADFHDEWYESPDGLIEVLRLVLEADPRSDWAFERLSLLLTMAERWDDLLTEYDRALSKMKDEDARIELLEEAARIAKDFAGKAKRASDYLIQLLTLKPQDDVLAHSLERRLKQQARHGDLIEVWKARLAVLGAEDALDVRARIAKTYLEKLNDADRALAETEKLLDAEGGESLACKMLERLAAQKAASEPTRKRSLSLLKARYSEANRGADVIRVIELALGVATDRADQLELHREAVEWQVRTDRVVDAIEHAAAILVLAPDDEEMHGELRTLSEEVGAHDRYATALTDAANACADVETRVRLLVEAGQVREGTLADAPGATTLYRRVLDDAVALDESRLFAAKKLTGLLVADEQLTERLDVLERLADLDPDEESRRNCLGEAAGIAEQLHQDDRALSLWQKRIDDDAGDIAALDARVHILQRLERWAQLIVDLRLRTQQTRSDDVRRADLVDIATIQEQRLGALADAITTWNDVRSAFGDDAETTDALVRLSKAAGRWDDVIELLRGAVKIESDDVRRADQLSDLGEVVRTTKASPVDAVEYYQQALEIDPRHLRSREGLESLLDDSAAGGAAVETLAAAYRAAGDFGATLGLLERRLATAGGAERRQEILMEAAATHERYEQDAGAALRCLRRAFALLADRTVEREITRLAEATSAWDLAVEAYEDAVGTCDDEARTQQLLLVQGSLYEERLGALHQALNSYRRILDEAPGHVAAACALTRVSARTEHYDALAWAFVSNAAAVGTVAPELRDATETVADELNRWDQVTGGLESLISQSTLPPEVAHAVNRELGIWHRDKRHDAAAAEKVLRAAVAAVHDADTLRMLAELQRVHPGVPLVRTLLLLADAVGDDLSSLHEAASTALDVVGDTGLAEPILEKALSAASTQLQALHERRKGTQLGSQADEVATYALSRLVALARNSGRASRALELLKAGASLPFSDDVQVTLTYQAAEVAHSELHDDDAAIKLCRSVLARSPAHMDAIDLLGRLFSAAGLMSDLLELRRNELSLDPPLERRLVLRLEEARLLGKLERPSVERVAVLERNLEESPGHAETIDRIRALLEASASYEELHDLLRQQAERIDSEADARQSALLLARAGDIAEHRLDDTDRALDAYTRSVAQHPTVEVLDALSRIFIAQGDNEGAVAWLEQRLSLTGNEADAVEDKRRTIVSLARCLIAADQADSARRHLTDGLAADPASTAIREVLVDLHRENEDWEHLAPILAEGVQYAESVETKIEYLKDAAKLHRSRLGQLDAAIPLLEEAVRLAPEDRDLRLSLANALAAGKRYEQAEELLRSLLEEFGRRRTPEKAVVHFQLARIARATGDLDTALDQLQSAASIERSDPGILKLLGDVALQKGELERAERSYRALLLILGRQRSKASSTSEEIAESAVLFQLHQIARRMEQEDRAQDLLDSAMEAGARGGEERVQLEAAFNEFGQHELLLRFLEQLVTDATGADRASILMSKGHVLGDLGRKADAFNDYLEAIGIAPTNERLRESTTSLAAELGELPRLVEHVDALASTLGEEENATACEHWMFLASLKEREGEAFAAASYLEKAQITGASPLQTYEALREVLQSLGDDERMASALRRFIDAPGKTPDPEKLTDALYSLAALELRIPEMLSQAAGRLERAIERDGDLARGMRLLASTLPDHPAEVDSARLFERLARDANDDAALLDALECVARLETVAFDELREAVDRARAAGRPELARKFLERAVEVADLREEQDAASWAFSELASEVLAEGHPKRAGRLLKIAITGSEGQDEEFALLLRLGALAHQHLDDLKLAQRCFEKVFRQQPGNPEVWQPLFAVYRASGKVKRLEKALAATEAVVTDSDLQGALRIERINLLIDTSRGDEAEAELREILELNPGDERASDLLVQLLEQDGRTEELRELVQSQYDSARDSEDPNLIAIYALKLGKLLLEVDREQAIDVYQNALNWCSGNRDVLEAALAAYEPEVHDTERADTLELLLALEEGERAEKTALTLVSMREAQGDNLSVGRALEIGFKACPTSEVLRERLTGWYEAEQDWMHLAELHMLDAQNRKDPKLAFERYKIAADMFYQQLGDAAMAAKALEGAHGLRPLDIEVLNTLTTYLAESGDPQRAKDIVTQTIEDNPTDDETTALLYHMRGALRAKDGMEDAGALALAAQDLEQALTLGRAEVMNDVVTVLEHLQGLQSGDDELQRNTTLRLATFMPRVDRLDDAVDLLADWANAHMEDVEALTTLGTLAMRGQHWETAGGTYMALCTLLDGQGQIDTAMLMADAWENAGEPLAAKETLEAIHEANPGNDALRKRLLRVYEAAGAHQELATMLLSQADAATEEEQKFRLLCDAGAMLLEVEGAADEALATFAKALEIKPGEPEVTVLLANAQIAKGEIEEASSTLMAAIDAHGKRRTPILSDLQQAMAKVAAASVDIDGQFQWLEAALQSNRQNGSAAAELAVLAMDHQNYDLAIKALQIVTLLKDTGPMSRAEAYLRQGMIAKAKGDDRKAVLLGKRALSTDPEYEDARQFLEELG